jgi:hypothetical protein
LGADGFGFHEVENSSNLACVNLQPSRVAGRFYKFIETPT